MIDSIKWFSLKELKPGRASVTFDLEQLKPELEDGSNRKALKFWCTVCV